MRHRWVDETSRPRRAEMEGEVGLAFQIGGPSAALQDQFYAVVASGSTNYLVVWVDARNFDWDIYGARVSPAGAVMDVDGIAISVAAGYQYYPCASAGPAGPSCSAGIPVPGSRAGKRLLVQSQDSSYPTLAKRDVDLARFPSPRFLSPRFL